MDTLTKYRDIVEKALRDNLLPASRFIKTQDRAVFDRNSDNYLIMREGWDGAQRIHHCVVHLEIINGKIWVQEDWTEHGVAADLEEAGIPKSDIVLGFQPASVRPHTEYAVA